MAENSNPTRTAYLVVTHPTDASVKSVISFTQSQAAPTTQATLATAATTLQSFYFRTASPCDGGPMKTLRSQYSLANKIAGTTNLPGQSSVIYEFNSSQFIGDSSTQFDGTYMDPALCGGGNNGCILAGELVLMEDGTSKKVEDVVIGDRVKGITLPGLSLEEDSWETWSTNDVDFASANTVTEVKSIQSEVFHTAFNLIFNTGSLKVTGEHPVLTKREDGSVLFVPVKDLGAGDAIRYFPSNSWETLTSIETIDDNTLMSYNLDAEAVDNYIAGGIVVHNAANLEKDDNDGTRGDNGMY
jgi:hypothetical protein